MNYNIMFPITSYDELTTMLEKGCKEFFGGVGFGEFAINDRKTKKANFADVDELNRAISLISSENGVFNLIVNVFENTERHKKDISEVLKSLKGNYNLIVKDFELIDYINGKYDKNIHVSTIVGILNYYGIEFLLKNFKNIKRVCLERDIHFSELERIITQIIENGKKVEIEILAAAIGCGFSESSCKLHGLMNCSVLKTSLLSMTGKTDCSYCTLSKLYKVYQEKEFDITLKVSSRDRSFEERLEHYDGLKKFIDTLKGGGFDASRDIYKFRNENHNNDCEKFICGYF